MAVRAAFDRPIFIVSSPRSGSSLLFLTLARAPGVFTTGGESHALIETIGDLHPNRRDWTSNRLIAADATATVAEQFSRSFYTQLRDRDANQPDGQIRAIEKTPKNSLRVPFFGRIFPDAVFVYLYRDPRETLASMMEAWQSGRFRTYPRLPGWIAPPWSLLLVPGWRALIGKELPEVVACQWAATTSILAQDLAALPSDRVFALNFARLVADPDATMARLTMRLGLKWDVATGGALALSPTVVSEPRIDKWRDQEQAIAAVLPIVQEADAMGRAVLHRFAI